MRRRSEGAMSATAGLVEGEAEVWMSAGMRRERGRQMER